MTGSRSYRECWETSVGSNMGGQAVAIITTLDPLVGILANASVVSQSLQLFLQSIQINWTRQACLLFVTIFGILPLCMMRNLHSLAPFSAVGILAIVFTLAVTIIRYIDGSYDMDGGIYVQDIPIERAQQSFGTRNNPWSIDALPFVTMAYTTFDMHFNSPRFYAELRNASIPRFRQTTILAFGITAILYASIAIFGFLTFGQTTDSYLLNNYSPHDPLATISRLAIGLCALVTYPLNFMGVRDNCLDILGLAGMNQNRATTKLYFFTVLLLGILTTISCFVTDLGVIMSVGGGTLETLVDFVFPAIMFYSCTILYNVSKSESYLVIILMGIGVVVGLMGVWSSIFNTVPQ